MRRLGAAISAVLQPHDIIEIAIATLRGTLATPNGVLALVSAGVAAAFSIAGTFMKTMIPLRWLAVGTNVGFLGWGLLYPSLPMLLLHGLLLPINIWRALEMVRLTRRVTKAAKRGDLSGLWLKPYMKSRRMKAGEVLFHKGDTADHLYFLAEGEIEVVEIGKPIAPGSMFGEIAFFAPDRRRTMTARCATDCRVLTIDENTLLQLYYQNPSFGFELVRLVAGRLTADVQRLESRLAAAPNN
jgi:CRP/FNR family transcriptional regulator, cyclic AMP receptor protein